MEVVPCPIANAGPIVNRHRVALPAKLYRASDSQGTTACSAPSVRRESASGLRSENLLHSHKVSLLHPIRREGTVSWSSLQVKPPYPWSAENTHDETVFFQQRFSLWSSRSCCGVSAGMRWLRSGAVDVESHVS